MATYRIEPDKLGRQLIAEGEKTRKAYHRGVMRAAMRGKRLLVQKTKEADFQYLGQFRNSFQVENRPSGPVLYNDAPHAGIVELGARPHPVSEEGIQAIAEWVKRKLMAGEIREARGALRRAERRKDPTAASWRKATEANIEERALRIANAIAWKIRRSGQVGRYIFRDNLPALSRFVAEEVHRAIDQMPKGPGGGK